MFIPYGINIQGTKVYPSCNLEEEIILVIRHVHWVVQRPQLKCRYERETRGCTTKADLHWRRWGPEYHLFKIDSGSILNCYGRPSCTIHVKLEHRVWVVKVGISIKKCCTHKVSPSFCSTQHITVLFIICWKISVGRILRANFVCGINFCHFPISDESHIWCPSQPTVWIGIVACTSAIYTDKICIS